MYTGYILADFAIAGLAEGRATRRRAQGLIDGAHSMGTYDQAGLACEPVDVSLAGRGKVPATSCGYVVQLKGGKFVPFPKNGKPVQGKLVGSPEALAAPRPVPPRDDHHRRAGLAVSATTVAIPETLGEVSTPSWLTSTLSCASRGSASQRHSGPDRRAGVDECPDPGRVRARGPARALADPVCEGVLFRSPGTCERAQAGVPRRASTRSSPTTPACGRSRGCGPAWIR